MNYWYKLVIAYDGTDFHGWQWQPNQSSIQETIKKTFLTVFNQTDVYLVGASRTDAGVHAQGQVIRIGTQLNLECSALIAILNKSLPLSIHVKTCLRVEQEKFHPQHDVISKTYSYTVFTRRPCPTEHRYGYYYWNNKLNLQKLKVVLELFIGTHDFKSFAKKNSDRNSIRTITSIDMLYNGDSGTITIIITGISFLQHMIRRIVGACLAIASDPKRSSMDITKMLQSTERSIKHLPTAPACGLCLEKIIYQEEVL